MNLILCLWIFAHLAKHCDHFANEKQISYRPYLRWETSGVEKKEALVPDDVVILPDARSQTS